MPVLLLLVLGIASIEGLIFYNNAIATQSNTPQPGDATANMLANQPTWTKACVHHAKPTAYHININAT